MVYSVLVGGNLGLNNVPIILALPILIALVLLKAAFDVSFKKDPIFCVPSPYTLYVENPAKSGTVVFRPWQSYLIQMGGFGTALGILAYGVGLLVP